MAEEKTVNKTITKLNWKRIIDEIPEIHDILAYGDMNWVK